MRTIVISDIHGCAEEFKLLLMKAGYQSGSDQLILLGDYVDKGPDSCETVELVMELVIRDGAIALRGNHDQRLVDLIRGNDPAVVRKFADHGGPPTLRSYCGFEQLSEPYLEAAKVMMEEQYSHHLDFLSSLPLFHENNTHIYVHAGLRPGNHDWKSQSDEDFMYIKDEFYLHPTSVDKPVVFGHTITTKMHKKPDIWFADDKIGIDGGCSLGMQLNALILEDGLYRSEKVRSCLQEVY